MRSLVTTLEAEASAGGTAQHRRCVELYYEVERWGRFMTKKGWLPDVYESSIESGQSAGTLIITQPEFHSDRLAELPDPITEESLLLPWIAVFEGRDPAIVDYRVHDFETYFNEGDEQDADYWEIYFSMSFETTRPLPAGEYQFFFIRDAPNPPACTKVSTYYREGNDYRLTVTAPNRTVHEAFFDPVDIGTAVGADGANGVLEPSAFSLDGTTTTISSLKWEDGEVTMALSPTSTSLADYAIDFIDTTGTTTLSLTSDNASTTANTWTVPDAPWAAGDLLMLRIHNPAPPPPVTVTITPRPQGGLTFFDLTITWDDPQTCDGRYFAYVGTGTSLIKNLGFHAASVSTVTSSTGWLYDSVPDYWAFVRCDPSGGGQSRDVGRASLRAALE